MKLVIDPSSRTYVEMAFSLYGVEKGWSYGRIAKHFNSLKVDGSDGWTGASIRQLLARPLYIGVRIFNKVRYERDPETNKLLTIRNPRHDWVIKRMPELRFISNELWKQVRRRAAREQQRNPNTGRRLSRNERCASTVFSGTLVCGSCGHEITLGRSGKYKVFACRHGTHGTHGCTLNSYKSVKILEECLLGYIRHRLLSEPNLHALVQMANEAVERELTRPPEDLIPLEVEQTKLEKRKARLAKLLTGDEEEEDLLAGLKEELKSVQKRLNEAGQRLRAAQDKRRALPTKLEPADVLAHVAALNETLAADVPAAAEAIRALTGQIRVTQRKAPGRRGAVWVVRLRPNVAELLDVPRDSPAAGVSADEVEVVIEPLPKAVRIAPQVRALMSQNARVSVGAIAQQLKIPWLLARASVQYVTTGKLPNWSSSNRRSSARSRTAA